MRWLRLQEPENTGDPIWEVDHQRLKGELGYLTGRNGEEARIAIYPAFDQGTTPTLVIELFHDGRSRVLLNEHRLDAEYSEENSAPLLALAKLAQDPNDIRARVTLPWLDIRRGEMLDLDWAQFERYFEAAELAKIPAFMQGYGT